MAKQNDEKFFEITGHLYKLFPIVEFESGFKKREFILERNDVGRDGQTYKSLIRFECRKDWMAELDNIGLGSEIKAHFLLGGKEWTPKDSDEPKYINYLTCWKVDVIENTNQDLPAKEQPKKEKEVKYQKFDEGDDLPF
jgi:hypothetical protein